MIYLTLTQAMKTAASAQILDTLEKHQVKAAFFLVGNYIEQNPELVCRMAEAGHTVGNHTYHHYDMSKIADKATFTEELRSLEQLYEETTGQQLSKFYRPPQGVYSQENLQMAQELGYHTVFWSLAYMDWVNDKQPTADAAFSKLIPGSTTARSSCCTAPPGPMRRSWMSCSPAGKSWATGSERWRSSLPHPSGDAQKCRCVIT